MTLRRHYSSFFLSKKVRQRLALARQRMLLRTLKLEMLEDRRVMAGPQLAGILPDDGHLLAKNEVLDVAPLDLTFRFDENTVIDTNSLSGIKIWRTGFDGTFSPAEFTTDFNTGGAVQVAFSAKVLGTSEDGISISFTKQDFGGVGLPTVTVSPNGRSISIVLNSNLANATKASELVQAVNNNSAANRVISAAITSGSASTNVAAPAINYSPLTLQGANPSADVQITPAYLGLGGSSREVIARFAETLPDDKYHIEIFGNGATPLKNSKGEAFNSGQNYAHDFELDLGAQVIAVVPQPVERLANGKLTQRVDEIDVYFNNDDLAVASVTNPTFYQLIYTNNTVENTDDGARYNPVAVTYDATTDKATLKFSNDIAQLRGAGTYRLRLGTNEGLNLSTPRFIATKATASSDFNTAGAVRLNFEAVNPGEAGRDVQIVFSKQNLGPGVQPVVAVFSKVINVILNNSAGSATTAQQLMTALNTNTASSALIVASLASGNAATDITTPNITYSPIRLALPTSKTFGSSFDTAYDMTLDTSSKVLDSTIIYTSAIDPEVYTLQFPGDGQEPGHRDIPIAEHIQGDATDTTAGISLVQYNFRSDYGWDPSGNPLSNVITENQKQRAREAFEIISQVSGVQFVESPDQGITIATGDTRALFGHCGDPILAGPPYSGSGVPHTTSCTASLDRPLVVLDNGESWDDGYGGSWFQRAMHEIFISLGLGTTYDLPPGNIGGNDGPPATVPPTNDNINSSQIINNVGLQFDNTIEPAFPGPGDIVHLQHLYRPESKDIDMYRFVVDKVGLFTAETIAERRLNSSMLDTALRLYQEVSVFDSFGNVIGTKKELAAQNDDYFSKDSYVELELKPGTYWIGVSASGNTSYDPIIEDTGIGGKSQGEYDLRLNFRPRISNAIVDTTGKQLDGDNDGKQGGVYNYWFRVGATLFVDKANDVNKDPDGTGPATNPPDGNGSLANPYDLVYSAVNAAQPGQIIRVVGNSGTDNSLATLADNYAYEIGFNSLGTPLPDGATLQVPKGVTMMVDAGAIFKMRRSEIGVGSTSPSLDRSGSALQILGTPTNSVYFTSYEDSTIGRDTNPDTVLPRAGDWGGLAFRRDVDRADLSRFDYERQGIFVNYVNHADMRYGGGVILVDGSSLTVNPIHMTDARPTVSFNTITRSADAAMSASPNSFEETNFNAPQYQYVPFTLDYDRIGPAIYGNQLKDTSGNTNTINGLAVRVNTPAGSGLQTMTVTGRWDDRDIVHVVPENLVIAGTPGGPTADAVPPTLATAIVARQPGAGTLTAGTYNYKITFVDSSGNESAPTAPSPSVTVSNGDAVTVSNLLNAPTQFIGRRVYRSGNGPSATYTLVAQINGTATSFVDTGAIIGGTLDPLTGTRRSRLDAGLTIDPAIVVKLDSSAISTTMGGRLFAEATDGLEVIFTSLSDDRFGAGGTFLTRNDGASHTVINSKDPNAPAKGDWAGLILGPYTTGSIDHAVVAFGGGLTRIEGNFTGMNALEIHQSNARITNSLFEENENGLGGAAPVGRFGRGFNEASTIFVRGAQPIIAGNTIVNGNGTALSINVNALDFKLQIDPGRSIGTAEPLGKYLDNQGPLVRENRMEGNLFNAMAVRGETVTTESVWDDTDIVHFLQDTVYISDFHTYGGVRLESSPTQSLVVKAMSLDPRSSNPLVPDMGGFIADGRPLEIDDRIGGIFQVLGQPGYPVVMTSIFDSSIGAGLTPDGQPLTATTALTQVTNTTLPTIGEVNNGLLIDNDVATGTVGHFEVRPANGGDLVQSGVTVQGNSAVFVNQNYIFDFLNYIDTGSDGKGIDLSTTKITQPATLIGPDLVTSAGTFVGPNGTVNWRIETRLDNGVATVFNKLTLTSANPLGNIRFISYLDEDVQGVSDDILYPTGTPGAADFRAFTLDGPERIGFSHGGVYLPGADLVNASYTGWAANSYPLLQTSITGAGTAYSVPGNIVTGNLPPFTDPALGQVYGPRDVTTAFAWNVDSTATTATMTSFLELIAANPTTGAAGGDWRGVRIEGYAHDRNVATILENEPLTVAPPGRNGTPAQAQFLGQLAPTEKGGDENRRLGFTVQGTISSPSDIDVYSFMADAGTEVWLDIDRTTQSLDSVIELIGPDGSLLAQSDNSYEEGLGARSIYVNSAAGAQAFKLQKTPPFNGNDRWSVNPRDAGMRVILPGQPGTTRPYHVRVRSSNLNTGDATTDLQRADMIGDGITTGVYQLQVRLQETDEIGGTTVTTSEIRYAQNGIAVIGQPGHSPLAGEGTEITAPVVPGNLATYTADANNTFATAQPLGNLLTSDRSAISVAGQIASFDPTVVQDIDWFRFDVDFTELESATQAIIGATFDIDYADGLARPNVDIWVFDRLGRLVLRSASSNVGDDRPAPVSGSSVSDLNRGSVGALDAFVGTANLVTGTTATTNNSAGPYYVAIAGLSSTPAVLDQFTTKAATNTLVRLEPINSLVRIADDHIEDRPDWANSFIPTNATEAITPKLLTPESVVPFDLGNVPLFVGYEDLNPTTPFASNLITVNPFTGRLETIVNSAPYYNYDVGDIAMRYDGKLYTTSLGVDDASSGNWLRLNTGDGTTTFVIDDGIDTFEEDLPLNPGTPIKARDASGNRNGTGIQFEAMTFLSQNDTKHYVNDLIGIGNRPQNYGNVSVDDFTNLVYQFTNDNANALGVGIPAVPPRYTGAGTDVQELGRILSGTELRIDNSACRAAAPAGFPFALGDATVVSGGTKAAATCNINDTTFFDVNDGENVTRFEFDTGPEALSKINTSPAAGPVQVIRDGNYFLLDPDPAVGNDETIFQFDTGAALNISSTCNAAAWNTAVGTGIAFTVGGLTTNPPAANFEFIGAGGKVQNSSSIPVDLSGLPTLAAQPGMGVGGAVATLIANAINGAGLGVVATPIIDLRPFPQPSTFRITLTNDRYVQVFASPASNCLGSQGGQGYAPILEAVAGSSIVNGSQFQLAAPGQPPFTFQFIQQPVGGPILPGDFVGGNSFIRAIPYVGTETPQAMATLLAAAITGGTNQIPFFTPSAIPGPTYGRVVVGGEQLGFNPGTSPIQDLSVILGRAPVLISTVTVAGVTYPVEETSTMAQLAVPISTAVNATGYVAAADINRINFPPLGSQIAQAADFLGMGNPANPIWVPTASTTGTTPFSIAIPFEVDDDRATLLTRIRNAINGAQLPGVTAQTVGAPASYITFVQPDVTIPSFSAPVSASGNGPGGTITGIAALPGGIDLAAGIVTFYAVSDRGGFYRVEIPIPATVAPLPTLTPQVTTTFIASSTADLNGIDFTGLTPGPINVEGGRYANMFFATDRDGRLYAIDTQGVLQPIFVDGKTSVLMHWDTTAPETSGINLLADFDATNGVQGLAFSTLDRNLWNITTNRKTDLGHGRNATYDTSRFGEVTPVNKCDKLPVPNLFTECGFKSYYFGAGTYDFPGGAMGSIISEEFSLLGYSQQDQPTLYFSYFLQSQDNETSPVTHYDALKVYVTDDSGVWTQVATNDDTSGANVYDTNNWRQARISLGGFAGRDRLRLRFDFSTAGELNIGDIATAGEELRAVAGDRLHDGDTFRIDNQTFEFDMGATLTFPTGMAIADGEQFTVSDGVRQVTYEFDSDNSLIAPGNVRIYLNGKQTGSDLAQIVRSSILLNGPAGVTPRLLDNQVNLEGATSVVQTLAPGRNRFAVVLSGVFDVTPGNIRVPVHLNMSRDEVANAMDVELERMLTRQAIIVQSGNNYDDGDMFTLSNGTTTATFEFEAGYVLTLPSGNLLQDGQTLKLFDTAGNFIVIEVDKDSIVQPGSIAASITNGMPVASVARTLLAAIQLAPNLATMGISASVISGSRLQIQANSNVELKSTLSSTTIQGRPGVTQDVRLTIPGALGIQVPAAGGQLLSDQETFSISNGGAPVVFELDSNGAVITPGATAVPFTIGDNANTVAASILAAINSTGIGLTPTILAGALIDLDTRSNHTINLTNTTLLPVGVAGTIADGESFTIGNGTTSKTFEFDNNGVFGGNNTILSFTAGYDPAVIAQNTLTAIATSGISGFNPSALPLTTVKLGETAATSVSTAGLTNIQRTGIPGDSVVPVVYQPSITFAASNVATAIAAAINSQQLGVTADATQPGATRRVVLTGNRLALNIGAGSPNLVFEAPVNLVKQDEDLFKIIGHTVTDQGPLGLQAEPLAGEQAFAFSDPLLNPVGYNSNLRGQNNAFEGFYLDDVIIGFAERGEMVTGAKVNTAFNTSFNPPLFELGPYQLEIRRSEDYSTLGGTLVESFLTNDRLTEGVTLIAHAGAFYHDGQTFTLSDGVRNVTFEFNDKSITAGQAGFGTRQGNVPIDFSPTDPDWQIATVIRDVINGPVVQNYLPKVVAALVDGTDGKAFPGPSTSNRINLFGQITLGELSATVSEETGSNDTLATAIDTGIRGIDSATYIVTGEIGDNPSFPLETGHDVDMYRLFLNTGETIRLDIDADEIGSSLNPVLAVFNANGSAMSFSDSAANIGEFASLDPFITFTAPVAGTYFVGVSGRSNIPVAAPFALYNPLIEGSAPNGSTGFYRFTATFGDPSHAEFLQSNEEGDKNRFRDQGQLIISGNTVSFSAQFGILVDSDVRDAANGSNATHQGPVRTLREINTQGQVPGVVVMNNLLTGNVQGGIRFSGQTTAAGQPNPSVPFGRILNNTIVGIGGTLLNASAGRRDTGIQVDESASPTLLNNIVANTTVGISIDGTSQTSVVGGSLYQGNATNTAGVSTEAGAIDLGLTEALFVDAAKGNFYLKQGSQAIDSSVDSLPDRPNMVTVRNPLGIPPSPVLTPDRDLLGLLRVDDPTTGPSGSGQNVFKDRGALDRADFAGSVAIMLNPRDEVFVGAPTASSTPRDQNGADGVVQFPATTVTGFELQLIDGVEPADPAAGVGLDDSTISPDKILLLKNNELQEEGIEYSFSFDALNNVLRLSPLAGVWETNKTYTLELVNRDQFVFGVPDGSSITEGQTFTVADASQTRVFEFDSGYTLTVPSAVTEGTKFSIRNGALPAVIFEFDSSGAVEAGNVAIPFTATSTRSDLANAVAAAITSQTSLGLIGRNITNGQVHLGGTTLHMIDVMDSTLALSGQPGTTVANAIAVPYVPGYQVTSPTQAMMSDNEVADAVVAAIQSANLVNVRATSRAYLVKGTERVEVVVRGATTVAGFNTTFTSAIRDLAGNDLKANNVAGSTLFTVLIGNGLDYGDAPTTYPVSGVDAASHEIVTGFWLGSSADAEGTGIVSAGANGDDFGGSGDDEDGVVFTLAGSPQVGTPRIFRGGPTTLTVTASAAGYLDAFVDFNRNGNWNDPGERVLVSQLVAGANALTFNTPFNAASGTSYVRFRFSSTGNLGPTGPATDGEVEDYMLNIGYGPWQNAAQPLDVSGDGNISAIDALLMINFLNSYAAGAGILLPYTAVFDLPEGGTLRPEPPAVDAAAHYLDVDGDGVLTPSDILLVINYLNAQSGNEGGEGEGNGDMSPTIVTASSPAMASTTNYLVVNVATPLATGTGSDMTPDRSVFANGSLQTNSPPIAVKPVEFVFRIPQLASERPSGDAASAINTSSDHRITALDEILDELADDTLLGQAQQAAHDILFADFDF